MSLLILDIRESQGDFFDVVLLKFRDSSSLFSARTVASPEAKKKAEWGSKGTVRDRVLMRRPLLHRHAGGFGSAVGLTDPPSFP